MADLSPAQRLMERRKQKALGFPPKSLADRINEEYDAANDAFIESSDKVEEAIEHALLCGELLTQAKKECAVGKWGKWVEDNG